MSFREADAQRKPRLAQRTRPIATNAHLQSTRTRSRSSTIDDDEEHNDNWWTLGVFGSGYAAVGGALLFASRHVGNPFRFVLTAIGFLGVAAGAWCLLWFFGIIGIAAVVNSKNWRRNALIAVWLLILLAMVVDWRLFGFP